MKSVLRTVGHDGSLGWEIVFCGSKSVERWRIESLAFVQKQKPVALLDLRNQRRIALGLSAGMPLAVGGIDPLGRERSPFKLNLHLGGGGDKDEIAFSW